MPFIMHKAFNLPPIKIDKATTGLRDVEPGYTYLPCHSIFCMKCGHLATDVRFNNEQMKSLYAGYRSEDYVKLRDYYEPGYAKRNSIFNDSYHYSSLVESFISFNIPAQPKSILDWGGDTGINTPFQNFIKLHHVYDISNVNLINNAVRADEHIILKHNYDLIVCQHVLEHLPHPARDIIKLLDLINQSTYLYFEVPHEPIMRNDSINSFPDKLHWHEHINFYSLNSMKYLLERCGLEVIAIESTDVSTDLKPYQFIIQCLAKYSINI
jgi:hypothetical protein